MLIAQQRRETSYLQTMAAWALRMSPTGWALVRRGKLVFTNRSFDALDRGSLIGPGWRPLAPEPESAASLDGQRARSLREIAVEEAELLFLDEQPRRRHRFVRGEDVVEVLVERPVSLAEIRVALLLVRDVTDQVKADAQIAAMSARLNETERGRVAAELAVGLAHDLGNLVGALRARVAALPREPAFQSAADSLRKIVEAQAALVSKLQSVAHPRLAPPVRLNLLGDVIQPAIQMVETSLRMGSLRGTGRVSIQVDPSVSETLSVWSPRDELTNVVINLFFNARDAMPRGGVIRVLAVPRPGGVALRVEDEGTGIAPEILPRIFEPLFSTKGSRGMGLGLATAAALMDRLGGTISARNRLRGRRPFRADVRRSGSRQPEPRRCGSRPGLRPATPAVSSAAALICARFRCRRSSARRLRASAASAACPTAVASAADRWCCRAPR